eukprot:93525-Pelagomonas_calceolata.AAC.1
MTAELRRRAPEVWIICQAPAWARPRERQGLRATRHMRGAGLEREAARRRNPPECQWDTAGLAAVEGHASVQAIRVNVVCAG